MSSERYQEFIAERARLLERIKELETENAEHRKRLGEPVTTVFQNSKAIQNLSLLEKVDLFCSLFKGRNDVFARRWYSKTSGKAGYQPVCQNEWTPLCNKRKYKFFTKNSLRVDRICQMRTVPLSQRKNQR